MPSINPEGLIECIKELLKVDDSWIPQEEGYSMYIRPTAIGTSPFLGSHLCIFLYQSIYLIIYLSIN
jgi:hypothetical protein